MDTFSVSDMLVFPAFVVISVQNYIFLFEASTTQERISTHIHIKEYFCLILWMLLGFFSAPIFNCEHIHPVSLADVALGELNNPESHLQLLKGCLQPFSAD